jgi:aspartate dehydrogenase
MASSKRRVGIVGFGSLGRYLTEAILTNKYELEIGFIYNRSASKIVESGLIPEDKILHDLNDFERFKVDVIVEVSHPDITREFGVRFLTHADYYMGSPTAFADKDVEKVMRATAESGQHCLYVPAGALWGGQDIEKLGSAGTVSFLEITMKKHPLSLKLEGKLGERVEELISQNVAGEQVLFKGSVGALCPLAPNNVNTMAAAAIAASNLGFDGVRAKLVSDNSLMAHVITIDLRGPVRSDGSCFKVFTERINPAAPGAITGSATYAAFLASLIRAKGHGAGVILC